MTDPTPDPSAASVANGELGDVEQSDAPEAGDDVTIEDLINDLERLAAERDELVSLAKRTQADFENFRKRTMKQQTEEIARATGRLVEAMLPVLDAFDYAAAHGEEALAPMRDQLYVALEKQGLARIESDCAPFDTTEHEAVAHEPADEPAADGPVVSETMRAGYHWQGQLLRPAMVKVKG